MGRCDGGANLLRVEHDPGEVCSAVAAGLHHCALKELLAGLLLGGRLSDECQVRPDLASALQREAVDGVDLVHGQVLGLQLDQVVMHCLRCGRDRRAVVERLRDLSSQTANNKPPTTCRYADGDDRHLHARDTCVEVAVKATGNAKTQESAEDPEKEFKARVAVWRFALDS